MNYFSFNLIIPIDDKIIIIITAKIINKKRGNALFAIKRKDYILHKSSYYPVVYSLLL